MKERITMKQLKELTIDQSIKLKSWWQPRKYDVIMVKDKTFTFNKLHFKTDVIFEDNYDTQKEFRMPLLSIGQMLNILYDYKYDFINTHNLNWYGHNETVLCSLGFIITSYPEYICDALWETVKSIL